MKTLAKFRHMGSNRSRGMKYAGNTLFLESLENRCLLNGSSFRNGVWTIRGDMDRANPDDSIILKPSGDNPAMIELVINGQLIDSLPGDQVRLIRINGGRGDDSISIDYGDGYGDLSVVVIGGSGDDVINGGPGPDRLMGGPGSDTIKGSGGDDLLIGGSGRDDLNGEEGSNRLFGGSGRDTLRVQQSEMQVKSGPGRDVIYAPSGVGSKWVDNKDIRLSDPAAQEVSHVELEDDLLQSLMELAVQRWQGWFGQTYDFGYYRIWGGELTNDVLLAAGGVDYSQTNVQEAGVDEADLVKTDGDYIYLANYNCVTIIDASPADEMHVVSQIELDNTCESLYLIDDTLVVISGSYWVLDGGELVFWHIPNWQTQVVVTMIDVSDPSSPEVIQESTFDGTLETSRAVDGNIHMVIENNDIFPCPILVSEGDGWRYETEAEYRERIETKLGGMLAGYRTTSYVDDQEVVSEGVLLGLSEELYLPDGQVDSNMVTLVTLDVEDGSVTSPTTIFTSADAVYASTESLYVIGSNWYRPLTVISLLTDDDGTSSFDTTNIYKFDLTGPEASLAATGTVAGSVLNQFSMDEQDGYFRIATTVNRYSLSGRVNNVYVLEDIGGTLEVAGSVVDLAPGEQIYSVRFMEDKGYVVTYRQVDPLFVLDLSDPYQPEAVGELKIPGFSSYLQPVGDDLLVGLGYDADENGGNLKMQLSLFDVSDPANPVRMDTYTFSDVPWGSYSEALNDYHAFAYYPEYQMLALPVWQSWSEPAGLQLIEINPTEGFRYASTIEHDDSVRRSLRIEENLYTISDSQVKVHAFLNLDEEIASIDLL